MAYILSRKFYFLLIGTICGDVITLFKQASGKDKAFLPQFFKQIGGGAFGPIDLSKTVVRGWSGGAQMVSWMIQVMADQPGR